MKARVADSLLLIAATGFVARSHELRGGPPMAPPAEATASSKEHVRRRTAAREAGRKLKGRKREPLVKMDGRLPVLDPQAAGVQDRDGGRAGV